MDPSTLIKGCKTCCQAYWGLDGTIQCKLDPHNKDPNGPVARWLCTEPYPWMPVTPCPAWEHWNEYQTLAR